AASPLSRAGLGLGADWAVLGTVARFDPVKRLDALVDALQFLNRRDVALLLVGDGPEATRLRRRVAATGLGARVVFAGWLDDPERRARMGRAGRARVAREFALQPMVAKTAEIYRAAATASARSSR